MGSINWNDYRRDERTKGYAATINLVEVFLNEMSVRVGPCNNSAIRYIEAIERIQLINSRQAAAIILENARVIAIGELSNG